MGLMHDFCWAELMTDELKGSKEFYSKIFGWEYQSQPMPGGQYVIASKDGTPVIGILEKMEEHKELPNHWGTYVRVESVDQMSAKVKELGGDIVKEAWDIPGAGRMSVVQDPEGAVFSLWELKGPEMPEPGSISGKVCWNELASRDNNVTTKFYTDLFGWTHEEKDFGGTLYTLFNVGEKTVSGSFKMSEEMKCIPPHWLLYFKVDNCEESTKLIEELKGDVMSPPKTVEGVGTYSIVMDPYGSPFGIISD